MNSRDPWPPMDTLAMVDIITSYSERSSQHATFVQHKRVDRLILCLCSSMSRGYATKPVLGDERAYVCLSSVPGPQVRLGSIPQDNSLLIFNSETSKLLHYTGHPPRLSASSLPYDGSFHIAGDVLFTLHTATPPIPTATTIHVFRWFF